MDSRIGLCSLRNRYQGVDTLTGMIERNCLLVLVYGGYPVPDLLADEKALNARAEAIITTQEVARARAGNPSLPLTARFVASTTRARPRVGVKDQGYGSAAPRLPRLELRLPPFPEGGCALRQVVGEANVVEGARF